jgi:hypothetical protein
MGMSENAMEVADGGSDAPAEANEEEFGEPRPLTGVRPITATDPSEKEVEERSHYLIARVMSATEKRIQRIMSAGGSRASSAATRRASSALTAYSDVDGNEQEWNVAEDLVAKIIGTWTVSDRWKHCTNRIGRIEVKYLFEVIFSIPTRRRPIPNATASVLFAVDPGSAGIEGMLRAQSAVSVDNSAHVLDIGPPPDATDIEGQAEHIVGRVLSATDRLVNSIIEDETRPGTGSTASAKKPRGVSVVFTMETQDLVHNAGNATFREQWLHDILAAKRGLFDVADSILEA